MVESSEITVCCSFIENKLPSPVDATPVLQPAGLIYELIVQNRRPFVVTHYMIHIITFQRVAMGAGVNLKLLSSCSTRGRVKEGFIQGK